jgi:hypothetical protein
MPKGQSMRLYAVLVFAVGSTGCAAIIGTHEKQFNLQSAPEGADVYLDGNRLGTAPLTVRLSNHKTHVFTYRKDGFKDASCTLNRGTNGGWVVLDVLFGLVPIVIDAATNSWSQTVGSVCVGRLEPMAVDMVAVHSPVGPPTEFQPPSVTSELTSTTPGGASYTLAMPLAATIAGPTPTTANSLNAAGSRAVAAPLPHQHRRRRRADLMASSAVIRLSGCPWRI